MVSKVCRINNIYWFRIDLDKVTVSAAESTTNTIETTMAPRGSHYLLHRTGSRI